MALNLCVCVCVWGGGGEGGRREKYIPMLSLSHKTFTISKEKCRITKDWIYATFVALLKSFPHNYIGLVWGIQLCITFFIAHQVQSKIILHTLSRKEIAGKRFWPWVSYGTKIMFYSKTSCIADKKYMCREKCCSRLSTFCMWSQLSLTKLVSLTYTVELL